MDRNKDDYSKNLAFLDFKAKMKLFESHYKTKQSSEAVSETSTRERPQTKSVSTVSQESPNTQTDKSIRSSPLQESPKGNNERPSNESRQFTPHESSKGESAELKSPSDEPRSLPLQEPPKGNNERPSNESRSSTLQEPPKGNERGSSNESRSNKTFEEELQENIKEVSSRKNRGWSPEDMEVFKHPMCLISVESVTNEHGEEDKIMLKSEQEVFKQIEQIEMPMVIVAVVGLYRTGKSYLMNRLAESTKGDTIQSKTKGIWVWCKMHPKMSDTVLLLLDTEGLGDVEKGDTSHDNKIFTLATLLCNCLVYNMKGAFDNDAVSKLTFVTEMAKNIRFRGESSEDNKTLNLILPDFVLCLRDFSLKLIIDGKKISANEYLEKSLSENKSKAENFNKPRKCIRKFFQQRMCFVFPVSGDGDALDNLETLSFDDLSSKFRNATSHFVSHVYSIPPKNLLTSKPVTGPMFVTLVDRYVTAIKHGAVPDVDDAFEAVAKVENAKIEKEAIEIFEHQIEGVKLPVTSEVLGNFYTETQQNVLNYLRKNVVHDKKNDCERKAQMNMDNLWNKIRQSNNEKIRELCDQKLKEAFAMYLEENFENKIYELPGGYRKYQRDIARLKEAFESDLKDFKEHEIMWTWHGFVNEMKEIEAKIVQADEELSIKEKEDEQRRNQECIDKLLKEHQKALQEALEQQKKDLESHYNKLEKNRLEQLQTERQKYEELLEEKMKNEKEAAQQERNRIITEQEERKKEMEKANKLAFENATEKAKNLILENENEGKNKGMVDRPWNELQTRFKEDHVPRVINVIPAKSQFISDPLREEVLPKAIGLKQHFMPEPYETEMRVNVQVERLQTDKKGLWRKYFEHSRNFEYDAKRLLLEGTLPDHRLYQKICKKYGRKSEIIRNISNGICQNIKEQSKNIVHVWPAYRFKNGMDCSEDQIVFVVITNGETSIQTEYQIFQRHLYEISSLSENENKTIQDNEKFDNFRSDDLAFYVKSKAKQLMETHKNLTRVTVSVIKSSGHEQNDHRMVKLHCIALYVQIKGLIPINDDPFEQFLDGFPVDVREGVFSLYGLPTDLHQNVRMGCALDSGYGTNLGTVGPFFKYETDLHTYLLTSAHVLLVKAQMQKLIVDTKVYYGMLGTDTYQPPESISVEHYSRHHLGKLEFAVYREGEQNKPGMEVALVRIDKQRVPIDGKFPTNEINDDYILSLDDIGSYSDVYKYGSVTGLTKGKVRFIGGSVRTGTLYDDSLEPGVTLHEQIEVESADGVPFGKPGDSGALVFRKDEDKLVAIGIFEGKINHTYMVTPIRGIVEVLSEFISHYRDSPTDAHMDFDEQTSNITLKLCHVRPNNVPLPLSAEIGHHISTEITRQTNEIQAIILHHTEHKFDSVKAELTDIKKHIDTTIDNSKREIIESVCGHISSLLPAANNYK